MQKEKFISGINIKGLVEIINGDNRIIAKNKFTQAILSWLTNITSINAIYLSSSSWALSTNSWNIYLGTDQVSPTLYNTTVLITPIGSGSGTAAITQSGITQNPSNGVFNVIFTSTWNPGDVSGTIGEMALYLNIVSTSKTFGWNGPGSPAASKQLISRLAVADGSFSPFTINILNPLTINWTIQYSFS